MTDAQSRLVANPAGRYAVGDRSGLVPNADGSLDVYIQAAAPASHESNWLPAPAGDFMLWLRAYQPGAAILDGEYTVPPVGEGANLVPLFGAGGVAMLLGGTEHRAFQALRDPLGPRPTRTSGLLVAHSILPPPVVAAAQHGHPLHR